MLYIVAYLNKQNAVQ